MFLSNRELFTSMKNTWKATYTLSSFGESNFRLTEFSTAQRTIKCGSKANLGPESPVLATTSTQSTTYRFAIELVSRIFNEMKYSMMTKNWESFIWKNRLGKTQEKSLWKELIHSKLWTFIKTSQLLFGQLPFFSIIYKNVLTRRC